MTRAVRKRAVKPRAEFVVKCPATFGMGLQYTHRGVRCDVHGFQMDHQGTIRHVRAAWSELHATLLLEPGHELRPEQIKSIVWYLDKAGGPK